MKADETLIEGLTFLANHGLDHMVKIIECPVSDISSQIEVAGRLETNEGTFGVTFTFTRKPHPTSEGEHLTDEEQSDE